MSFMLRMRDLGFVVGTCMVLRAKAVDLESCPPETTTITIPYLGSCTTSTTFTPCTGPVTVIVETPIVTPVCTSFTTTTSTTTTSSTTTTTSTVSTASASPTPTPQGACLLINPLCTPAGLNIEYYANPFAGYSSGSLPPSYYISENLVPLDSSLTNETFFPQNVDPTGLAHIYPDPSLPTAPYFVGWTRTTNGGVVVDANNFTVVYQGFYRAPATGTYQLCATADNEDALFFGADNAFNCLDGKAPVNVEPIIISTGASFVNGINCTSVNLVQGFYYPIRNVMGNWQGPSAFNFTIGAPGVPFASRTNNFAGDVYPHDCGVFI